MYATDRGIEELVERRGDEQVSVEWLADRLRVFVDLNPQFEDAVERVAAFLARDDFPTLPVVIFRLLGRPGELNYGMALAGSVVLAATVAAVVLLVERLRVPSVGAF